MGMAKIFFFSCHCGIIQYHGEYKMKSIRSVLIVGCLAVSLLLTTSCTRHEVEVKPVEIKPIHITIDVNVKVDRALDDFFSDLDNIQQ